MKKIRRNLPLIIFLPLVFSGCSLFAALLAPMFGDRVVSTRIETINNSSKNLKVYILCEDDKEEEFNINIGQSFSIKKASGVNRASSTPYQFVYKIIISDENSNKLIELSGTDIHNSTIFRYEHDLWYVFEITDNLLESKKQ
jgi:hypothetical protein